MRGRRVRQREWVDGAYTPDGRRVVVYPGIVAGRPGVRGIRGNRGPRGPVGPKGARGAVGAAGAAGADSFWTVISDTTTPLATQLAGLTPGEQVWLEPGTYTLGGVVTLPVGGRLAGTREATVHVTNAGDYISLANAGSALIGLHLRTTVAGGAANYAVGVSADRCLVHRVLIDTTNPITNRLDYGIYLSTASDCEISENTIRRMWTDAAIYLTSGGTEVGTVIRDNYIEFGTFAATEYGVQAAGHTRVVVRGNYIDLGAAAGHIGLVPGTEWVVAENMIVGHAAAGHASWGVSAGTGADSVCVVRNSILDVDYGIDVTGASDDWVVSANLIEVAGPGPCRGIWIRNSAKSNWAVTGNLVRLLGPGVGIYLDAATGAFQNFTITGNLVTGVEPATNGIFVERGGAMTVTYLTITANVIRTSGSCIILEEGVWVASVSANVCRITASGVNCISVVHAGTSAYYSICGNVCRGVGANRGIHVNADDCTVSCNNSQDFPVNQGCVLTATADDNVGIGNVGGGQYTIGHGNDVDHNLPAWGAL